MGAIGVGAQKSLHFRVGAKQAQKGPHFSFHIVIMSLMALILL